MDAQSIRAALADYPSIRQVIHCDSLGSTNDLARQSANEGAAEIVLISADEQTSGRGRLGRTWVTPPATALAISLLTRPVIPAQQAMRLTMLAGLAAVEGIERETGLRLDLKWPNDIVTPIPDPERPGETVIRKLGGILTECAFQNDQIEYAIIGLGLNVNVDFTQQEILREKATSLLSMLGRPVDRLEVLKAIVAHFIERYALLKANHVLRDAWAARLINLGRKVRVRNGPDILAGLAESIDTDGALLLRTNDGQLHRLLAGDVTMHGL
jgi:BirA family biotin operon repressor/biotin-[acetyl-CoA-carboxylase] ligase